MDGAASGDDFPVVPFPRPDIFGNGGYTQAHEIGYISITEYSPLFFGLFEKANHGPLPDELACFSFKDGFDVLLGNQVQKHRLQSSLLHSFSVGGPSCFCPPQPT